MEEDGQIPLDTMKITTRTLTLNGFTVWNTPITEGINRLEQVCRAAENYSLAADDLKLCDGNSPAKCECARLLQYYLEGFRHALNTAPDDVRALRLADELQSFTTDIQIALDATGVKLPPFPKGEPFQIPNGSVTELLIKSRYESLGDPPTTLTAFKGMIQDLSMCTANNVRPRNSHKRTWNGLPHVLFACVSHRDAAGTPLCVVGTSLDQWSNDFFTKVSRVWRNGRFPKENPATAQLAVDGARIKARFGSLPEIDVDGAPIKKTFDSLPESDDLNRLNRAMFREPQYPAPLPQQFGFLCSNEVGRPFAGRPRLGKPNQEDHKMYQEMCRCWKCRYMHHYNVNAESAPNGNLERESPTQTAVFCNEPFSCAEDLVQSQCARLRSREGQQAIPKQPETDIS